MGGEKVGDKFKKDVLKHRTSYALKTGIGEKEIRTTKSLVLNWEKKATKLVQDDCDAIFGAGAGR